MVEDGSVDVHCRKGLGDLSIYCHHFVLFVGQVTYQTRGIVKTTKRAGVFTAVTINTTPIAFHP